ncbi:hypothetical protein [Flavobacterium sp. U410]
MKKKLEGELISIAHRVLKLKNRSETKQLQEEAKKLYEQLTILRFYEENFEAVKEEIAPEILEEKLESFVSEKVIEEVVEVAKENIEETVGTEVETEIEVEEPTVEEESAFESNVAAEIVAEESVIEEEPIVEEPVETELTEPEAEEKPVTEPIAQPQVALFDDVFAADYQELDFVKVEDIPQEIEQVADLTFEESPKVDDSMVEEIEEEIVAQAETEEQEKIVAEEPVFEQEPEIEQPVVEEQPEPVFETKIEVEEPKVQEIVIEKVPEVVFEEPRTMSLNDRLNKGGINIGLNDRLAFEKKLFAGSTDDFNRVLSQLNTFDSFDEAKGFIESFVKPDYNNWEGNEAYELRFLEFVEKRYL